MNYPAMQFALNVLITLINIGIFIYNVRSNKEKVINERFTELEKRMTSAESKIKSIPVCSNHGRMEDNDTKLFERLDELHGDIREMVGGMKGLTNQLGLINEYLLKGGK